MKLKNLHEGKYISKDLADRMAQTLGSFEITDALESYLRENLRDELVNRSYQNGIVVAGGDTLTSIAVREDGIITLTHYPAEPSQAVLDKVVVEKVNVHDPDSFPKILEFVSRYSYE